MWLFFIKKKGYKGHTAGTYSFMRGVQAPFVYARALCTVCFFLCLPFLEIAWDQTIMPFVFINIVGIVADFICKATDPEYYYW